MWKSGKMRITGNTPERIIATGKTDVQILFDDVAPKFKDVNGGYTTILKTYNRKGDNAPMAILSLTK